MGKGGGLSPGAPEMTMREALPALRAGPLFDRVDRGASRACATHLKARVRARGDSSAATPKIVSLGDSQVAIVVIELR